MENLARVRGRAHDNQMYRRQRGQLAGGGIMGVKLDQGQHPDSSWTGEAVTNALLRTSSCMI